MVKILHITNHYGTRKNIENVCNNIDDCSIVNIGWNYFYYINSIEADSIYKKYEDIIKDFDFLFFTDTSMYARPFLQNLDKHNCKIIVYVTNRFDWGIWQSKNDREYYNLYSKTSRNSRVFFCSDNRYDQYYTSIYGVRFFYDDIIRLTPERSDIVTIPCRNRFFIYNRGTNIDSYRQFIDELNIQYDIFGEGYGKYKDKEELTEYIGMIHLPYQTNVQSFLENISYNIIYFIPSKKFFKELVKNDWYYWEEKKKKGLLDKSIELSEWYQKENEVAIEYFNSWKDLSDKIKSYVDENGTINYDLIDNKKNSIFEYINKNFEENIIKWKNILKT